MARLLIEWLQVSFRKNMKNWTKSWKAAKQLKVQQVEDMISGERIALVGCTGEVTVARGVME